MKVISLGWGVQSFTLAAMSALGEIEHVDYAIHADTTYEASWTYDFAKRWTGWLEEQGLMVVTVSDTRKPQPVNEWGGMMLPGYTTTERGDGQMSRQCTDDWKRAPMRRWLQANRNKEPVEQWLGISLDEYQRMKPSDVKYITTRWPLIEMRMTRHDCVNWLTSHGIEIPHRSACYFCPYHNTAEWRHIKNHGNGDWQKAVNVDNLIRKARPPYDLYLHPSRKPLEEIDFRSAEEKGQLSLWDAECSGICGV